MAEQNTQKRVTEAQRLADIKSMLHGDPPAFHTTTEDADAFIEKKLAQLANKNNSASKKETETQKLNETLMEQILDYLMGATNPNGPESGKQCAQIRAAIPGLQEFENQKTSRLCSILKARGLIVGDPVKGKKLWRIAPIEGGGV